MQVGLHETTSGDAHANVLCKSHQCRSMNQEKSHVESLTGWTLKQVATCIMWLVWNISTCISMTDSHKPTCIMHMRLYVHNTGKPDEQTILNMERGLLNFKRKVSIKQL
jgi:hypothetical protein